MGKKNKRKNKDSKKRRNPPLTLLDKCLYYLSFVIFVAVIILSVIGFYMIKEHIAFSDPNVIAYHTDASILLALPFEIYLLSTGVAFLVTRFSDRKPIFGSKKYKYGAYPFKEDCVPLFSRKKYNLYIRPSHKRFIRQMIALWSSFLIIFAFLLPFGLFGRGVMYRDHSIEKINLVNKASDTYTTEDFFHLTIRAYRVARSRYGFSRTWRYEITVEMADGKDFTFSRGDFNKNPSATKNTDLDEMLKIKGLFDKESITIKGAENVNKVSDYLDFDEEQRAKLKLLFSE